MAEQISKAPDENFARGLQAVEIPELGEKISGKVRDMWITHGTRVIVTTDRQSAFDHVVGTVPGKGAALNLTSSFWFEQTEHIVPNHAVAVPHPNVLIAKDVPHDQRIPIEMVVRRYLAKSGSKTSLYHNLVTLGKEEAYGIRFGSGLKANQELPQTVLTPTTKAETGHDEMLTADEARAIVDSSFGRGRWAEVSDTALRLFEHGRQHLLVRGLIPVDTKYEFGYIDGQLTLIDEINTPDSSRFWLAKSYEERFAEGKTPETYDKEILRRYLEEHGFTGGENETIPPIDAAVMDQMALAYRIPYEIATGQPFPDVTTTPDAIRGAVINFLHLL